MEFQLHYRKGRQIPVRMSAILLFIKMIKNDNNIRQLKRRSSSSTETEEWRIDGGKL